MPLFVGPPAAHQAPAARTSYKVPRTSPSLGWTRSVVLPASPSAAPVWTLAPLPQGSPWLSLAPCSPGPLVLCQPHFRQGNGPERGSDFSGPHRVSGVDLSPGARSPRPPSRSGRHSSGHGRLLAPRGPRTFRRPAGLAASVLDPPTANSGGQPATSSMWLPRGSAACVVRPCAWRRGLLRALLVRQSESLASAAAESEGHSGHRWTPSLGAHVFCHQTVVWRLSWRRRDQR